MAYKFRNRRNVQPNTDRDQGRIEEGERETRSFSKRPSLLVSIKNILDPRTLSLSTNPPTQLLVPFFFSCSSTIYNFTHTDGGLHVRRSSQQGRTPNRSTRCPTFIRSPRASCRESGLHQAAAFPLLQANKPGLLCNHWYNVRTEDS